MRRQITVAQPEPIRLHAVGREFLLGMPGFVAVPPTPFRVDAAAEGVHAGVEVGADAHPEHPRVVTDVDHRGQLMRRLVTAAELAEAEQMLYPEQEARASHAAHQYSDFHTERE